MSPPWRSEKSWRSQGEPSRPLNLEKSRAVWQTRGTEQALERKSRGDSLHPAGLGKGSETSGVSRARPPPRSLSPGRHAESTRRSQKMSPPSPVRGTERQQVKPGELLHLGGPKKPSECGWQSLREKLPPSHPGKGGSSDWKGRGKPLRPMSPTRPLEQDWGRGNARQAQVSGKDWKRQEKPVCHVDLMRQLEREWKSPTKCLDIGLRPDDSWKRPESPAQQLEDDRKGPEHTRDSNNPEKPLESDWGNKRLLIYHVSRTGSRADGDPTMHKPGKHRVGGSPGLQFCLLWLPRIPCVSRGSMLPAWHWEERGCFPPLASAGSPMVKSGNPWQELNPCGFNSCFLSLQPQLTGSAFPPQSSTSSSGSPKPHLNASEKRNKVGVRPWEW